MVDPFAELLDHNLRQGGVGISGTLNVRRLTRDGRTELAELLAGTDDKNSRDYKSARRRVERWQRKESLVDITPRSKRQLTGARKQQHSEHLSRLRAHGGEMRVQIENNMSENQRREWLPPHHRVHISTRVMRQVIREWGEGELDLAAGRLYSAFLRFYNVPEASIEDWMADTTPIDLELDPSR